MSIIPLSSSSSSTTHKEPLSYLKKDFGVAGDKYTTRSAQKGCISSSSVECSALKVQTCVTESSGAFKPSVATLAFDGTSPFEEEKVSLGNVSHLSPLKQEPLSEEEKADLKKASKLNQVGKSLYKEGKFSEALKLLEEAFAVRKKLAPNSRALTGSYNNIGAVYWAKGDLNEALDYLQASLEIHKSLDPDSQSFAKVLANMGHVLCSQGKFEEAQGLFLKAYAIRERALSPKDPCLIGLGDAIALAALKLSEYEMAISYADKVIKADPDYKYAYDIKGLALKNQNKLTDALGAFEQALICDPGYADASLHRLEVVAELAKKGGDILSVIEEIRKAQKIQKTDYDLRKKLQLEEMAKVSKEISKIELPKVEYEAGSKDYLRRTEQILSDLKLKSDIQAIWISGLDHRVSSVEERQAVLDGRVLQLEDSLQILKLSKDALEQKIASLPASSPLLQKMLVEKEKLVDLEKKICEINKNQDLRHYFYALLSELESAYLAAQILESGKFLENKSEKYTKAAGYLSKVVELVPVIGQVCSSLVTGSASLMDMKSSITEKRDFLRIRSLAPTLDDFNQIALSVTLTSTLKNEDALKKLEKAEIPNDWKTKVKSLKNGLEGLVTEFLRDNETKAKVLGRLDAYKVIAHLQKEAVCENYTLEEEKEDFSSRYSFIGSLIVKDALELQEKKGVNMLNAGNPKKKESSRCVIQ